MGPFEAHPPFGDWLRPPGGILLGGDYRTCGDSFLESLLAGQIGVQVSRHSKPPKKQGETRKTAFVLRTLELYRT